MEKPVTNLQNADSAYSGKPVTIADLMDISFYGNLKTDQNTVLFVKAVIDETEDAYHYDIMQYDPAQNIRQLTSRKHVASYIFKDPQTINFTLPAQSSKKNDRSAQDNESGEKDEDSGQTALYQLSLTGGEAQEIAAIARESVSLIDWIDDHTLLVSINESIAASKDKKHPDYEVIDEVPWYFNGQGFINKKRNHLYVFDTAARTLTAVAPGYSVDSAQYENGRIYFIGNPDDTPDWNRNGLYALKAEAGAPVETLVETGVYSIFTARMAGDELLVFASDGSRYGLNENPRLYRFDPQAKKLVMAANWDEALGNTVGTDCAVVGGNAICVHNDTLYFTSTIVEHNTLFRYEDGAIHQVFAWQGTIHSFGFTEEALYFIGAAPNELQQLYRVENNQAVRLSSFNTQLSDHYIARAQPVFYENHAGKEQMGWVLYPRNFNPDHRYPGILDIHGGPKTVYGTIFYHEMQVWASEGYFVFFCNPFGSDGQGNEYAWMNNKYGTIDYEDLMRFTDAVLREIPQIDPDRLGVTGGSYGGFMTNWIIGHTSRFAAAATQRSISNWISFYGTSDIGPSFVKDQQGCGLENIDQLWEHSPLKYVKNVKTPTLVIHSDEDYRCPLEQGMQMLTGIVEQNVPARMVLFHGENHDLSRTGKPSHRVRRLNEITDWMKHYAPSTEE